MARIYRLTDRLTYKVGELEIKVSPLSVEDKIAITEFMYKGQSGNLSSMMNGSIHALKCSIKEITGLTDVDGNEYKLEFENGKLTQSCAEDLLNIEQSSSLIALCSSFIGGIPSTLPEGVTVISPKKTAKAAQK